MSDIDTDPILRRAVDELRRLPAVNASAVRRAVTAAASARMSSIDEPAIAGASHRRQQIRRWGIAGVATAAGIIGFVTRAWLPVHASAGSHLVTPPAVASTPMHTASIPGEAMPLPQQFVFENSAARRVSVIGDFNRWNPRSAPMTRAANGVWSTVIPMLPGRHVYGFMIDDSLFRLDPRAPTTRDPDLGTAGSVVLVGRP